MEKILQLKIGENASSNNIGVHGRYLKNICMIRFVLELVYSSLKACWDLHGRSEASLG